MGLNSSKNKGVDSSAALSSKLIKKAIRNKQLAPILEGQDDDPAGTMDECPVCLLHFPAINTAACCGSSLCTDCYVQVALARSGHDAGVCPFCNKANYSVIYRAKTTAQRAAERREREHVEQAVLHARQEEERRSEHRRRKHAASASTPMSPEQGMLAEEWARAQEEEERYLSSRQERWREALARAAAAAEAGGEADDTDVEELMIMQALLLSLDEQHGGMGATEGAGGPSNDAGPSASGSNIAAAHLPRSDSQRLPGCSGGSGSAGEATHDAGHLSAGTSRAAAGAAASAASAQTSAGGAAAAQSGSSAPEAADVPDAELLAHAARLAERATAHQPRQLASSSLASDPQAADEHSSVALAEGAAGPAAAAGSDATVAYVHTATPADSSAGSAACQEEADTLEPRGLSGCGSAALANALAGAPGWAATDPGAPSSRPSTTSSSSQACAAAGIGSAALAQALAAANGWGTHSAAQVAAAQRPPFLGMVTVQAAAHIQRLPDVSSMHPACCDQGVQAAHVESPSSPQACAAGPDDAAGTSDATETCSTGALPQAGGAALLLQPDGSSLLVLLTNPAAAAAMTAAAAAAAEAALPPEAGQRGVAAAGLNGPGVPLYEINCEDAADRQLAAALAAADAALLQHSQAALSQQTLAMQTADEQYRVALDAYADRDAAMQQALRESDERLKAMYTTM